MRGFLAVFSREVGERRLVFLVAAALGLAPLASPLLLDRRGALAAEASIATAAVLAVALSALLATALGASIIAGELKDRRLAFYFARPLSGWAIWAGKLSAALAIALGAGLLVLLPAALANGIPEADFLRQLLALWPGGLLLLLLVAHLLGVIGRVRSLWILLDVALAVLLAGTSWAVIRQLQLWDGGFAPARAVPLLGAACGLALLAASAVQVIGGRTDLRRAHRLLSCTLWSVLLVTAAAMTGYVEWYLHPSPAALAREPGLLADPAGHWVVLSGTTAGRGGNYVSRFLVDRTTGRWLRIRPAGFWRRWYFPGVMFARDGHSAAWLERQDAGERAELVRLDLTRPQATPQSTGLAFDSFFLALSPDGRRIAALAGNRLTVTELASRRLLSSVPIASDSARLSFVSTDRVRIFQPRGTETTIDELTLDGARGPSGTGGTGRADGAGGADTVGGGESAAGGAAIAAGPGGPRLRTLGRIHAFLFDWSISADAERILSRTGGLHSASSLYDASSGRLLAVLPQAGDELTATRFLADGSLAVVARSPRGSEIRLLTRDGVREPAARPFHFARQEWIVVCGKPSPGQLLVMTVVREAPRPALAAGPRLVRGGAPPNAPSGGDRQFCLLRLDLARGSITLLAQGMVTRPDLWPVPLLDTASPAVLVKTARGWTWIDGTGKQTPLLGDAG